MLVHLLAMSVIVFFTGHALLAEDRNATFPSLVKASGLGMRGVCPVDGRVHLDLLQRH